MLLPTSSWEIWGRIEEAVEEGAVDLTKGQGTRDFSDQGATGNLIMPGFAQRIAQPFEALVQTITRCCAGRLNVLARRQLLKRW